MATSYEWKNYEKNLQNLDWSRRMCQNENNTVHLQQHN